MDPLLIGLISIAIGIFLGSIGIGMGVFWGLQGFQRDLRRDISEIKERITSIEVARKIWEIVALKRSSSYTVIRELKNLGKVKITARPGRYETSYTIEVEKPILEAEFISKLGKESGFEDEVEMKMFSGKVPRVSTPTSNHLLIYLPSTNPKTCTEYISRLLKWLDTTYFEVFPRITKEWEEPIQT